MLDAVGLVRARGAVGLVGADAAVDAVVDDTVTVVVHAIADLVARCRAGQVELLDAAPVLAHPGVHGAVAPVRARGAVGLIGADGAVDAVVDDAVTVVVDLVAQLGRRRAGRAGQNARARVAGAGDAVDGAGIPVVQAVAGIEEQGTVCVVAAGAKVLMLDAAS